MKPHRIILSFLLICLLSSQTALAGSVTKGQIGKQDISQWDGITKTFTRPSSAGYTLTLNKIDWPGVDVLQVYGGGVNRTKATISAALTAVGTVNKVAFWLSPGTWIIDDNLTITSNIALVCSPGAILSDNGGTANLAIDGPFPQGLDQVFDWTGSGNISFGEGFVEKAYPEWWEIDGIADDVQIQAAHDSLPNGRKIKLSSKTYKLASKIEIRNNNIIIEGTGESTIIDCSALSYTYEGAFETIGTLSATNSSLTSNADRYQLDIDVADASEFSAGNWIRISDDNTPNGSGYSGELQKIESIAGNTITCELALAANYTTGDNAVVYLVENMIEGTRIKNLKMVGWGNNALAVKFTYCYNQSVENVTISDFNYTAIQFGNSISSKVLNSLIEKCYQTGLGYGVSILYASRDVVISNNHFYDCRHAVTVSSSGLVGIPRNIVADGNTCYWARATTFQQFDTHQDGEYIVFSNNTVIGAALAVSRSSYVNITGNFCYSGTSVAVDLRTTSSHCAVTNNILVSDDPDYVIHIDGSSDNLIEGNHINNTAGYGIFIDTTPTKEVNDISIVGNKFNTASSGIRLYYKVADILDSSNISINNNFFYSSGAFAVLVENSRVTLKNLQICNNFINTYSGGIRLDGAAPGITEDILISDNFITTPSYHSGSFGGVHIDTDNTVSNLDIFNNVFKDTTKGVILGNLTTGARVRYNRFNDVTSTYANAGGPVDKGDSYSNLFMDVLGVSATHVRSNEDLSAAIPITFTLDAQPDIPRTLSGHFDSHAQITAYSITVVGKDAKGHAVTETKTEADGWDWETSNAFATITSITMTARTGTGAADTMDIGITDVLGFSNTVAITGDVYKIKKNNANAVVASAQISPTYNTYDMAVIGLAGGDDFTVWYISDSNLYQ